MAEVVSTGVSHMCDNSTVSVNSENEYIIPNNIDIFINFIYTNLDG